MSRKLFAMLVSVLVLMTAACSGQTQSVSGPISTPLPVPTQAVPPTQSASEGIKTPEKSTFPVVRSFYIDHEKLVEDTDFVAQDFDPSEYTNGEFILGDLVYETLGKKVVTAYNWDYATFMLKMSGGKMTKIAESQALASSIFLLDDGTYIEIRQNRRPVK